mgnify:CR=1 FL=1
MTKLHFIVNPISGNGKHNITRSILLNYFPKDMFDIEISYTEYKKHAIELAHSEIAKKADCIIACGGDGTINEVASTIVGTNIKLGIIPVGSGNGLASNLNIPANIEKAIAVIQKDNTSSIDVGRINEHYFFSNTGIGIDATIIKRYETSGKRTLAAYIKASLSSTFKFKSQNTLITINGITTQVKPFMLFISNSNEMGYNMSLTPKASLTDGFLDMIMIPKLSLAKQLVLGYRVLRNSADKFKKAVNSQIREIDIEQPERIYIDTQIDGEYYNLKTNKITVSIIEKGLKVITPYGD